MTIPKLAIEKAIAAGWKPEARMGEKQGVFWEVDALDPTFWQAVGKSLGWGKTDRCWGCNYEEGATDNTSVWYVNAHRFYDLILQGKDTAEFWGELLAANK